ncbi:MAG: ABC transporter permease [Lachnospiraceae bacterium]|nr:ABC transporter permease [Lachnospiraceae bacterium]
MNKYEIFIIMKKELAKFFGNKRMLFTTAIMPGIVVFVLYTVMGSTLNKQSQEGQFSDVNIYVINLSENIKNVFESSEITYQEVSYMMKEQIKQGIEDREPSILVVLPEKFDEICMSSDAKVGVEVEIYYNSSISESVYAYTFMTTLLEEYENTIFDLFVINNGNNVYDMALKKDSTGKNLSAILPMLLMGLIFSCCLSIAAESIAGEKERGTIAILLTTPVKRNSIALGKVCSLTIIALLSGISSYIGVILSLPSIMNIAASDILSIYGLKDYVLLLLTLTSIILVIISLMLIVSAIANSVKEATTSLSPFAAGAMLIGISCLIQSEPAEKIGMYFVPLYNSVQFIYSILVYKVNYVNFAVMLISNFAYTLIFVWVLAKLFDKEKVMFG